MMNKTEIQIFRNEAFQHLTNELLPFWTTRMKDEVNGGFITHFDEQGIVIRSVFAGVFQVDLLAFQGGLRGR